MKLKPYGQEQKSKRKKQGFHNSHGRQLDCHHLKTLLHVSTKRSRKGLSLWCLDLCRILKIKPSQRKGSVKKGKITSLAEKRPPFRVYRNIIRIRTAFTQLRISLVRVCSSCFNVARLLMTKLIVLHWIWVVFFKM